MCQPPNTTTPNPRCCGHHPHPKLHSNTLRNENTENQTPAQWWHWLCPIQGFWEQVIRFARDKSTTTCRTVHSTKQHEHSPYLPLALPTPSPMNAHKQTPSINSKGKSTIYNKCVTWSWHTHQHIHHPSPQETSRNYHNNNNHGGKGAIHGDNSFDISPLFPSSNDHIATQTLNKVGDWRLAEDNRWRKQWTNGSTHSTTFRLIKREKN